MGRFEHAAEELPLLMEAQKLTLPDLSAQTGVDPGILRSILSGKTDRISVRNLAALARALNMGMGELAQRLA